MVKSVGSLSEFEAELKAAGEKLVVVDFSATWCGPCKMIKPFFHSLCDKFGDVVFIEIDVDDAQDVATHCDVKCMPTFQFYKNGKKVGSFCGAYFPGRGRPGHIACFLLMMYLGHNWHWDTSESNQINLSATADVT
uniref:Thioredoxin n=1 Tax=Pavo cristatus TaxID=9049 RepID=A0A8C9LA58_PAVCR